MSAVFQIFISYGQIAVFRHGLEAPFNNWSEAHAQQGFSWRKECVAFRTLQESGLAEIEVFMTDHDPGMTSDASRIVEVPFDIGPAGIEIASISDGAALALEEGRFQLRAEFVPAQVHRLEQIRFHFIKSDAPIFALLRCDSAIDVPEHFTIGASAA